VKALRLAYSPCPNDTFIFHAWVHGLVPGAPAVREELADIDVLNASALRGQPDVAKVSFHALAHLLPTYALLHSGGALGRGVGPLLVARADSPLVLAGEKGWDALADALTEVRVAIPGPLTTAALMLGLFAPGAQEVEVMPFDRIMPAVAAGDVAAGMVIHEGRFTYAGYGLACLLDLGDWWEETTRSPLPLGGIVVKRGLGAAVAATVDGAVRASLERARRSPAAAESYIRRHAQEMDPAVCQAHIDLYVNDFSLDYGSEGEAAIRGLLRAARDAGIAPGWEGGLFWDD
jgi:1,4-dihydroxy-6-naphthoate synthase